jgi:hypothetical protein
VGWAARKAASRAGVPWPDLGKEKKKNRGKEGGAAHHDEQRTRGGTSGARRSSTAVCMGVRRERVNCAWEREKRASWGLEEMHRGDLGRLQVGPIEWQRRRLGKRSTRTDRASAPQPTRWRLGRRTGQK